MRVGRGFRIRGVVVNEGGALGQRNGVVLKREQGIGEMVKGLAHAVGVGEGEENVVTAVMVDGGGEVEAPSPMFCP